MLNLYPVVIKYFLPGSVGIIMNNFYDTGIRNFVGARGIEMIETKVGSASPTQAYPLYDGHGNMVATLSTTGTFWSVANERTFDVWGSVRSGATTGGPKGRYVANLGHVQDDESGLIYMRARYYEPVSGRFVSEDPAMDGSNWFSYCDLDPVNKVDSTGRIPTWGGLFLAFVALVLNATGFFGGDLGLMPPAAQKLVAVLAASLDGAMAAMGIAQVVASTPDGPGAALRAELMAGIYAISGSVFFAIAVYQFLCLIEILTGESEIPGQIDGWLGI